MACSVNQDVFGLYISENPEQISRITQRNIINLVVENTIIGVEYTQSVQTLEYPRIYLLHAAAEPSYKVLEHTECKNLEYPRIYQHCAATAAFTLAPLLVELPHLNVQGPYTSYSRINLPVNISHQMESVKGENHLGGIEPRH